MTEKTEDAPAAQPGGKQLRLSAVAEEFAAFADFLRQRALVRAAEVDRLRARDRDLSEAVVQVTSRVKELEAELEAMKGKAH